ncbi:hypothetical protein FA13DRAFT_804257 [Coprinellus micaceus]|uniref:Uncharacterized protein n=1 Tax=Coprinellus micaceus TaxID=71717 RepID=A0A4Y7T2D7_COPMI|nr:hypothetical protein FA13DRAFT_804257 [Coprinellus micaceus]
MTLVPARVSQHDVFIFGHKDLLRVGYAWLPGRHYLTTEGEENTKPRDEGIGEPSRESAGLEARLERLPASKPRRVNGVRGPRGIVLPGLFWMDCSASFLQFCSLLRSRSTSFVLEPSFVSLTRPLLISFFCFVPSSSSPFLPIFILSLPLIISLLGAGMHPHVVPGRLDAQAIPV